MVSFHRKTQLTLHWQAKEFAQAHLQQKNLVIITNLDVKGAFDAAWWTSILCNLRDLRCSRNLYNLTRSYFSDRVAIFHTNTYSVEKKVLMDAHKDPVVARDFGTFCTAPS
jgi:hypothetical protein